MTGRRDPRLGFFTRLLDDAPAVERYRNALDQFVRAEELGFDTVWVAQHHFHEDEGGLPSPFVLLAQAAARTSRIVLAHGHRHAAARGAAAGRGGRGGAASCSRTAGSSSASARAARPSSFPPFGHDPADRGGDLRPRTGPRCCRRAARRRTHRGRRQRCTPPAPGLLEHDLGGDLLGRGRRRASARRGTGSCCRRTQPRAAGSRPSSARRLSADRRRLRRPRCPPASRRACWRPGRCSSSTTRPTPRRWCGAASIARSLPSRAAQGVPGPGGCRATPELRACLDLHIGTPEQVARDPARAITCCRGDRHRVPAASRRPAARRACCARWSCIARDVAPALGWAPAAGPALRRTARHRK